jgi:hypothetical protein
MKKREINEKEKANNKKYTNSQIEKRKQHNKIIQENRC